MRVVIKVSFRGFETWFIRLSMKIRKRHSEVRRLRHLAEPRFDPRSDYESFYQSTLPCTVSVHSLILCISHPHRPSICDEGKHKVRKSSKLFLSNIYTNLAKQSSLHIKKRFKQ